MTFTQQHIFVPVFLLLLLTMVVWIYLYARRLAWIRSEKVNPQRFATRAEAAGMGPQSVQNPANNFANLLELPVLFYITCLYLYVTGQVEPIDIALGYLFVAARMAHSLIHCTVNRVVWRFAAYSVGAICLWMLVLHAALGVFFWV